MTDSDNLWITWEKQRRSIELSRVLGCKLYIISFKGKLRYPKCIYKTLKVLISNPKKIVFVQNPSMILAATACFYKLLFDRVIIVDRHSNFRLNQQRTSTLDWMVFDVLHKFTLKKADLTIVTNKYLADIVEKIGGRAHVLPDKLPTIIPTRRGGLGEEFNIFLISSFGSDEPIIEALGAARRLISYGVKLIVSGNIDKLDNSVKSSAPPNVIFTGFLCEEDFVNYIYAVDAVMVLTTNDFCMLCGCYEAVAARKPLITSNKTVLREYFSGSLFVDNTNEDISRGVKDLMFYYDSYLRNAFILKDKIDNIWPDKYDMLKKRLKIISGI